MSIDWAAVSQWFKTNSGNIYSGILASFIVLALQSATRVASALALEILHIRWRLELLWCLRKPTRVYVVSGAIKGVSEEIKGVVLAGPDAEASSTMLATVGLLYPTAEVRHVYSSSFPQELYKETLVVVGGPLNNACAATLLRSIGTLSFNTDFQMILPDAKYEGSYEGEATVHDIGAIVRVRNPFDPSKDVLLTVGCDTYGVLAAALTMSSRIDAVSARRELHRGLGWQKYLRRPSYIAIVECDVLGNDVGSIKLSSVHRMQK